MAESREISEPTPFPEETELTQSLLKIKILEESQREKRKPPEQVILLGGGGVTGRRYGPLFAEAGLPVGAVVDITPAEKTSSLSVLPQTEYYQVSADFSIKEIEEVLEKLPNAALVVMTPQATHADILLKLGPLIAKRGTPTWIDKPLAMSAKEADKIIRLIKELPKLTHLVVSGGYTLDKAAPELIVLGLFDENYPLINAIKSADTSTPDFRSTYLDSKRNIERLGRLKSVRFLFMEGRAGIREFVGAYGRTHLAFYPGGGITADLLEHLTDKLFRLGILDVHSELFYSYMGYTAMGLSATSLPWQTVQTDIARLKNPNVVGLAETDGTIIMFGKNRAPVILNYGKRHPESLGDIRRSILTFENATLETHYITSEKGPSNTFVVKFNNGTTHNYFIDTDPYALMLRRYKKLWSGNLQGQGGIYSQLCNAYLIEDAIRLAGCGTPELFPISEKFFKPVRPPAGGVSDIWDWRQQRDLESILKMTES